MSSAAPISRLTAREHHLPAAAFAVLAVALLVGLPELLGQTGRLAAGVSPEGRAEEQGGAPIAEGAGIA